MSAAAIDRAPRSAVEAFRAVRDLLAPEGAWLEGRSFGAIDHFGRSVDARSAEAVCWGVMAAFRRIGGSLDLRIETYDLLCRVVGGGFFWTWEELPNRLPADILLALDAAIVLGTTLSAGEAA